MSGGRDCLKCSPLCPCNKNPASNVARDVEAQAHWLTLSDAQILQLLDNLPEGEAHDRWRFAIQLCAVYGLRPDQRPPTSGVGDLRDLRGGLRSHPDRPDRAADSTFQRLY